MRSSLFRSICLVLGILAVCAGSGQAATASLAPDADSYVRASFAYQGQNYGTETILAAKDCGPTHQYTRQSYLKFNLPEGAEPISIAVLKLNCVALTQGAATVDVYAVKDDAWAENSVTYLNKPSLGAKLTSISVAATGGVEIPLNVFARQQQLGDGVLSIALVQPANQNRYVEFASREASSGQPTLEVSFDPTPPAVTSTTPVDGGTVDPLAPSIICVFSKDMSVASVENAFSMGNLSGTFTWSGKTMTFKPTVRLRPNTSYTVSIGTGAQALDSTSLAEPYQFSFSTPGDVIGSTLTVACDNAYEIYLNGNLIGSGSNWKSAQKYSSITLVPGKNVIAVKGTDAGGVAALLAELAVNGRRTGTGSNWKVTLAPPADWMAVELDDSSWASATEYGAYGVSPWSKSVSNMPTDTPARWIWSSNSDADNLVYFRWTLDTSAVSPAPANIAFSHVSDHVVAFSWQPAVGANPLDCYYEVYRDGVCVAVTVTPSYCEKTLTPATRYSYTVCSVNLLGNASPFSAPAEVTTMPAPPIGTGTGLLARIYDNPDFSTRNVVRVDPKLDFNWGTGAPATDVGGDTFSVQWQGQIQPQYSEQYTIYTLSDDGVRLWLDGQLVIDNWAGHSTTEDKYVVSLRAGQKYDIRVDYYDNTGSARIALLWQCMSQDKQVIPTTQLYPAEFLGILDVKLLTNTESPVSPAWVEWNCSEDAAALRFSVNGGAAQDAVRENAERCYGDMASAQGLPYGIPLEQESMTEVAITADDGAGQTKTTAHMLSWKPTKLNGKSWSEDEMVIRVNDSLLFTVESDNPALAVTLDADEDGTADYVGEAGMKFPFKYTAAGQYTVTAWLGEDECGTLTVTVVDADLRGPIACQIGYRREKFVAVSPVASIGSVSYIANNPELLGVSVKGSAVESGVQGQKLYLRTLSRGTPILQARLNGTTGPLIRQQEVDEFTLVTQATQFIGVIETFADGSMLVQTNLEMSPNVENLGVTLNIFVSGVTFEDSTLNKTLNTSAFTLDAESSTYLHPYQMIALPSITTGTCHTIKVMQGSEQVGQ